MSARFSIYKGLQKPLVYRGFKGKFIIWGIVSLILGLIFGSLVGALVNIYLGGLATISSIAAGLFYTFQKQKGGLHSKTRHRGIFIHPVPFQKSYANFTKDGF